MAEKSSDNWKLAFETQAKTLSAFDLALELFCEAVTMFELVPDSGPDGIWRVEGFSEFEPNAEAAQMAVDRAAAEAGIDAPQVTVALETGRDWLTENLKDFPPEAIGRYFIYGSHVIDPVPVSKIGLKVDAATAFGSGRHPSTRGCLIAFDRLARCKSVRKTLDMGCGSGILAMAMAKTFHVPVLAADLDIESVRVTDFNAKRNGVASFVRAVESRGFDSVEVKRAGPYDLIAANILARPLVRMARALVLASAPGGVVVLAGILATQGTWVINAYRAQGMVLVERIPQEEWVTLVLKRRIRVESAAS